MDGDKKIIIPYAAARDVARLTMDSITLVGFQNGVERYSWTEIRDVVHFQVMNRMADITHFPINSAWSDIVRGVYD